jgi:hypothetical protein
MISMMQILSNLSYAIFGSGVTPTSGCTSNSAYSYVGTPGTCAMWNSTNIACNCNMTGLLTLVLI